MAVVVDGERFEPAISVFPFGGQTIGTPATRSTVRDDLQMAVLAVPDPLATDGAGAGFEGTVVRVTVQPLVAWLWIGGAVMAVGTALAAVPGAGSPTGRARRRETEPETAPTTGPEQAR